VTGRNAYLLAAGAALGLILLAIGCSKDSNNVTGTPDGEPSTDPAALQQMMVGDNDFEALNAWQDDNDGVVENGGSLDSTVTALRWARLGHLRRDTLTVDIQGDTLATITRTSTLNGVFRILTDSTGGQRTFIDKPMANTIVRKAHAVRIGHSPRPRLNWRVVEVTPEVMVSTAPNPHTVDPVEVRVYHSVNGALELLASVSDPLHTYFRRDSLPVVGSGEEIVVTVTANTTNPVIVAFRPRVAMARPWPRLLLHDDGIVPDQTAGDGIYSGGYTSGDRQGIFQANVDVINAATVYDSEAPYDAGSWALPYRKLAN
jgi:hypothetical protein